MQFPYSSKEVRNIRNSKLYKDSPSPPFVEIKKLEGYLSFGFQFDSDGYLKNPPSPFVESKRLKGLDFEPEFYNHDPRRLDKDGYLQNPYYDPEGYPYYGPMKYPDRVYSSDKVTAFQLGLTGKEVDDFYLKDFERFKKELFENPPKVEKERLLYYDTWNLDGFPPEELEFRPSFTD